MKGSRACDACEIGYPPTTLTCPACGASTLYRNAAFDSDWHDRLKAITMPKIPELAIGAVRDENGRLWLYGTDLNNVGYRDPIRDFDAFRLIDDSIVVVQLYDRPRQRYWVMDMPEDGGF